MAAMAAMIATTLYGRYGALCLNDSPCLLWGAVCLYGRCGPYGALWPLWGAVSLWPLWRSMAAMGRCISMAAMALCGRYDRYGALWPLWGAVSP